MGKFEFNGKSSEDFGLVIQTPPTYEYPQRDITTEHVPGRNGDIVIDNKCYKNVKRTYSIGVKYYQSTGYYENFEAVLDWLNSANGQYVRLEDSYDSSVYRLASFQMEGSFVDYFGKGGAGTITFECKPQRFLKEGEKSILYNGNVADIVNDSSYFSKPLITVSGIETDFDNILMMTVMDHFRKATSSITISSYEGTMLFDSEEETVTDQNGNDLSANVGLNSLPFPELKTGRNEIRIDRYHIESSQVDSYSKLIVDSQHVCRSEYKTYAAIQQTAQEKIFAKSYKMLMRSKQETYSASSAQAHMSQVSSTYTFESFNTLLSNYGRPYPFAGTAAENASSAPKWIELVDENGKVVPIAKETGFYLVDGVHKKLCFRLANDPIIENRGGLSTNSVNNIFFYEVVKVESSEVPAGNPMHIPYINGEYYRLSVTYEDIPDWLGFKVEYEQSNDHSPVKLHYYRESTGYYWTDKTWIFGKAQWSYFNRDTAASGDEELASLNWNTSKKAFTNVSGLSLSTTSTFTYRYRNCDPQNLPDYEPIVTTDIDDRGVETIDVKSAVHFTIQDYGTDLSTVMVRPKEAGYYSIAIGDNNPSAWKKVENPQTETLATISGTAAFVVFYLAQAPNYSDEKDWPEWLDPTPLGDVYSVIALTSETYKPNKYYTKNQNDEYILATGAFDPNETYYVPDLVRSNKIYFKVLENGTYRVSADTDDDTPQSHMWSQSEPYGWKNQNANDYLIELMENKTTESAMYIYKIDESTLSMQFDYNRSYTVDNNDPSSTPPSWLIAENDPVVAVDQVPDTIKYKTNASGYFKWNSNESWVYYETGTDLNLMIGGKDDCVIYYMETLPEYTVNNFQNHDMFDLFDIEVIQSPNPGNPKEVNFKINEAGYYRANNGMSWKYLTEGETLLTSKIGDAVYLYHLKAPENPDLDGISISIKPRWWKL